MLEIVVLACLIASPDKCEEIKVPFDEPAGMNACMREGQFQLVRWQSDHPEYLIKSWKCER
jgi:hypothetical protein